jgi:hypothetical protein
MWLVVRLYEQTDYSPLQKKTLKPGRGSKDFTKITPVPDPEFQILAVSIVPLLSKTC